RLLELFFANIGKPVPLSELREVAAVSEWARVVRSLTEEGYQIRHLSDHSRVMISPEKIVSNRFREPISQKTRYRILQRDNSTCQRCGKGVLDKVKLVIDHKIPANLGGKSTDDNLWVLCEECNLGKKHWFNDQNAEEMKVLFQIDSGMKKLEKFFKMHPNELLDTTTLSIISGIRDWTRTI